MIPDAIQEGLTFDDVLLQPAHSDLGYRDGQFPHSEAAAREVLSLPMYPELPMAQLEEVAGAVREAQQVLS